MELLRENAFANFKAFWLSAKVFSMKWECGIFWPAPAGNQQKLALQKFPTGRNFPTIQYVGAACACVFSSPTPHQLCWGDWGDQEIGMCIKLFDEHLEEEQKFWE